jgi:hypothetical protein
MALAQPVSDRNRCSVSSGVRAAGSHTGLTIATRIVMLHPSCASAWW